MRDTTSTATASNNNNNQLEVSDAADDGGGGGRKRRLDGDVAAAGGYGQIPNFWMVANSGNHHQAAAVMGGDPVWTIPSMNNSGAGLYRGTVPSGLHFMNFPTPMALLPSQQLGPTLSGGLGSGGGNSGLGSGEGHLGLLTGLNPYRTVPGSGISESQASGSHSHHGGGCGGGGGDDRHDTTSHHS